MADANKPSGFISREDKKTAAEKRKYEQKKAKREKEATDVRCIGGMKSPKKQKQGQSLEDKVGPPKKKPAIGKERPTTQKMASLSSTQGVSIAELLDPAVINKGRMNFE